MDMDWWEDEENSWFDKYLPGRDLPDGLEWTPFDVDLTTAPDVTTCMYPGLRQGLQDAIVTVGCEDLETLVTHRALQVDVDSFDPSWDEPSPELVPELGLYPISRSNPDISQSAATSPEPVDLCLARYSEVDVLVEVRRALTPSLEILLTDSLLSSVTFSDAASQSDNISPFDLNLDGDERPLEESVIGVFNCQHRLFVLMILFVEDKARLLHFDRTGASMTPVFDYTHRPEVIGKFLYRLSNSRDRASMGHDPTATRANEADTELFRKLHTRYHAASAVGRGLRDAATEGWPVYKLCIEGRFSPNGSMAVLPNDPVSRREFIVGKPLSAGRCLCGRGTKTFVAYDIATKKIVVIKDSWRPNSTNRRSEYDTYLLLNNAERPAGQPFLIPTLLGGGDVIWDGAAQETRPSGGEPNPDHLKVTRTHFRLVLKEVCRPLEDFTNSLELVTAVVCAIDAHFVAWSRAHMLHRGISTDSILILDEDPEGPPDPRTVKGLLADWDLARTKEELENPAFTEKTRCGTWPFISARLQHTGPGHQRHELSDDLESFVHVLNYCIVKYLPNDLSYDDHSVASFISNVYDRVRIINGVETGSSTKLRRLIEGKPFVELQNPTEHPLSPLLQTLSRLCSRHYHHIQFNPLPQSHLVTRRGGMSVERGRFARMTVFVQLAKPEPDTLQDVCDVPGPATVPLPSPDPAKSPFNDHEAIARAFLYTLEPPNDKHPAYGLGWPVADKIKTHVNPLGIVKSSAVSLSDSEDVIPPYAPFRTPNPEHSNPAKRTRRRSEKY